AEDKAAADGVVGAFEKALAPAVQGGEEHRVGVEREPLAAVQHDVGVGVEGDLAPPWQRDPAGLADLGHQRLRRPRGPPVAGASPGRPSQPRWPRPWPCPGAPSEPNTSTRSPAPRVSSAASDSVNIPAARIGPTVCELDGPMPILNRSNALIAMARLPSLRHWSHCRVLASTRVRKRHVLVPRTGRTAGAPPPR